MMAMMTMSDDYDGYDNDEERGVVIIISYAKVRKEKETMNVSL